MANSCDLQRSQGIGNAGIQFNLAHIRCHPALPVANNPGDLPQPDAVLLHKFARSHPPNRLGIGDRLEPPAGRDFVENLQSLGPGMCEGPIKIPQEQVIST